MKKNTWIQWMGVLCVVLPLMACSKSDADAEVPVPPVPPTPPEETIDDPVSMQLRSTKRGVSFEFRTANDIRLLAPGICWAYNWGVSQSLFCDQPFREHAIDFCPMAWNNIDAAALRAYTTRNPACNYLLAFNEPNLTDQAHLTPREAADRWPAVRSIAQELGLRVVSPAMNYGTLPGYGDPIVWLDEFFTLVSPDEVDAIAIHCYMSYTSALKSYVERFRKYGKPIWLTEFCAWEGKFTPEFQQKYLCEAINYLESEPLVARYAWFIPCGNDPVNAYPYMYLLDKSSPVALTSLGKVFVNLSSQDKQTYHPTGRRVEAEHYSGISMYSAAMARPTGDSDGELELYDFKPGQWVEYQVEVPQTGEYTLNLRYASSVASTLTVEWNGGSVGTVALTPTYTSTVSWKTTGSKITLEAGKKTLRLRLNSGSVCLNWFSLK